MSNTLASKYDYIVAGSGAAGLSLLVHMISSGRFSHKKILLIDKASKDKNDRTWCLWEEKPGPFESIVYKQWKDLSFFAHTGQNVTQNISPYTYKLIRGIDFYNFCLSLIRNQQNIAIVQGNVEECGNDREGAYVLLDGKKLHADYVFNSILWEPIASGKNTYLLQQHFKGWFVRTRKAVFNAGVPVLMDFRVNQLHGTTFVYTMPFSETDALVEYTIFSSELLTDEEYETALRSYCSEYLKLGESDFEILSKEKGAIPMTNFKFPARDGNVMNIGTAGGQTRGSTGYTFSFIQKHSEQLVKFLSGNGSANLNNSKANFYDSILLNVLQKNHLPGHVVFDCLFLKNNMKDIFKFLDNESNIAEDLKIISSLPIMPFTKAAIQYLSGK